MKLHSSHEAAVQPFRDRVRKATREAILQAAEGVFSERGFAGARMEEIAERAGMAVGTLYNYFDDRGALLQAVLEASATELTARMEEGALPAGVPFKEQVERFFNLVLEHQQSHFRLFAILVQEELEQARSLPGAGRRPLTLRPLYNLAQRLVENGVREGALRAEDADLYPTFLLGMVRGVFTRQLLVTGELPSLAAAGPMTRFFLHGAAAGRR